MRLFIAINFDESTKKALQQISDEVKKHAVQGRFVKRAAFTSYFRVSR